MSKRRVYIAFSTFQFRQAIFFRIASIVAFYFLLKYYSENPDLFLVLMIIDVMFFLSVSYQKIKIYEDRLAFVDVSLLSNLFRSKGTIYSFEEISGAKLPEASTVKTILRILQFFAFQKYYFLRSITGDEAWTSFYLEMKKGDKIPIYTSLADGYIMEVVEIINTRIEEWAHKES